MRHTILLLIVAGLMATGSLKAQHHFKATSLSEALIALDHSTERYDISFVYDELEDFTVTTDIRKSSSVPDAVRQVCGFYPVKVSVKGRNIFVECIQKDRTKLTGRLVDAHNQPIAYANILLYHPSDSTVIGGGVSNEAGDFVIPCSAHEARVKVSCIGYQTLERALPIGNVGTLRLQTANIYLGPVSVNGHVPVIHSEADRLSYIVSRDAFARELTAMELLNRVPMVSVTGGNASILGKGPAHFMLNGRMVEHDGETIRQKLWSMRAEDIERIEVISVPSGEYQTEAGGYINIVLNTAQSQGWRADLSGQGIMNDGFTREHSSSGYSERLNASLSYGSQKLDFSLDLQQSWVASAKEMTTDYTHIRQGDMIYVRFDNLRTDRHDSNVGMNAMLRFRPSERLELGAMLSSQSQRLTMESENELRYHENKTMSSFYDLSSSGLYPNDPAKTVSLMAYTDWKLDQKGKKLNFSYNYFQRKNEDKTNGWSSMYSQYFFPQYTALFTTANVKYKIHDVKLNLTMPFKFVCIDAGLAYTDISNPSYITNGGNDDYALVLNTTDYDYCERTAAAYLTLQRDFFGKRLSAKAGLRLERTWLEGETNTPGVYTPDDIIRYEENNRTYNELLPTLHLAWRLGRHHQLSLAYGVGINRPNLHDMNPLQFFFHKSYYMQGNPALFHGKTKSLELSYTNGRGLNATAYYHKAQNQVEWITEFYNNYNNTSKENAQPYQMAYPINCVNYEKSGFILRYQHQFSHQFSAMAEGEVYYYDADAAYMTDSRIVNGTKHMAVPTEVKLPSEIDTRYNTIVSQRCSGWGGRLAMSTDLFLNRKHTWMVSGRYDHWFKDYQGITCYDGYGYFSFAVRCSLLRDRLKLSLTATDPFSQYIVEGSRSYTSAGGIYPSGTKLIDEHFHTSHHLTNVSLTATYSLFNHTKIHYTK